MALESYCASCTYLGDECDCYGKFYCSRNGEYRYANDGKCYNYCEAYSRSNSSRINMFENSKEHLQSGCYLTTIMSKILKYDDHNYYLNTLRNFRDNIMQPNPKYLPLLIMYDSFGPMIAYELEHDKNNEEIATTFFNQYITRAVSAIECEKNNEAINIYIAMTTTLAKKYNIDINPINIDMSNYDKNNLGHAKVKKINNF